MHSFIEVNRELKAKKIPNIVTIKSFALYLLMPTLVYQEKFPQLEKIRIRYILEKLFEIAILLVIYLVDDINQAYKVLLDGNIC